MNSTRYEIKDNEITLRGRHLKEMTDNMQRNWIMEMSRELIDRRRYGLTNKTRPYTR